MGKPKDIRDRCKEFYQQQQINGMLRQGDPVEDLMAFVISEIGRSADVSLKETLPLCLYFDSAQDRDEFVAAIQEAKPGMRSKKIL